MLKLFGPRIAVKKTEQKFEGRIALPPNRFKLYDLGKITAASDETLFEAGQLVLFQITPQNMDNSRVNLDNDKDDTIILHQNDVIARLTSLTITLDAFQIAGRYVLLKPFLPKSDSIIIVPDTASEPRQAMLRYKVAQRGDTVTAAIATEQEVYPDRGRCNPLQIGNDTFVFVDQDFILGAQETDDEAF